MPGYEPDADAIDKLTILLQKTINKPNGITVTKRGIAASGSIIMPLNTVVGLENLNRVSYTHGDVLNIHVLITNSYYIDQDILATSYWNTSICIFGKSVFEKSGGAGQVSRSVLFATLLQHEFGHLLGLIDQGSPMRSDHRDVANGAHCNNTNCLMYYNVEQGLVNSLKTVPLLDAACIQDLKGNGGK